MDPYFFRKKKRVKKQKESFEKMNDGDALTKFKDSLKTVLEHSKQGFVSITIATDATKMLIADIEYYEKLNSMAKVLVQDYKKINKEGDSNE